MSLPASDTAAVHAPRFDIDIELRRGDFRRGFAIRSEQRVIAVVGDSGVGKTSLLHAIAGLLRPSRGHIEIAGQRLFDSAARIDLPAHRRRIGYVFQDARLFPHLDVRGNLLYGLRGEAARETRFQLGAIVELLGIGPLLARGTAGLSGGEMQRVALGRALLSQPRIVLLDEPLSMLDMNRRDELLPYLQRVRDETGLPMIYVSHYPEEVRRIAGEVHSVG
ncbi:MULTISPECIES: ATP-binding cassette domain-containing protein [unclassified Lysobacter]|uniref:ATP-binding cassette domain-containing protein n=1 Tax=unclassified Lysobacter TaxID=2635362 RepID=UPI001BE6EDD0|nr:MULTISPECIES: ATP-binding cassette domain-containing protein [unclassified Lysobacter]MBT2748849.1 ATP-binding cassette domain-containing protein [Lysobacter sp. ISL-42]MBT2751104.1 ATP-binding cassette domain-containing protein [Lysobacter sp. ISL-50]MBT2779650.1 ATP-binding cassette domain-containing protein [Lysobacter sp. ISL-54]MBT2783420.1 ATP-binding cassette domain-containing protein [Lysobacter sp. ISL-52]